MKTLYLLLFFVSSFSLDSFAQNGIIGDFGAGWSSPSNIIYFLSSAGTSRIQTIQPPATGNRYFRLVRGWAGGSSGEFAQFGPAGCADANWTAGVGSSYNSMPVCGSGAFYINCPNTTDRYIFKTRNPDTEIDFIYFRVQGAVQTISNVTRDATSVNPSQVVTVTATLSSAFAAGQGAYLRYTTNGYASSTIVPMSGSGTTYTATIPANINTAGATISYYVFTSGSGITVPSAETDYYTINLNNNGGANYNYTVSSAWETANSGAWNLPASWLANVVPPSGVPLIIKHAVVLDQDRTVASLDIRDAGSIDLNSKILTFTNNNSNTITVQNGSRTITNSGLTEGVFEILTTNAGSNLTCNMSSIAGATLRFGTNTKLSIRGDGTGIGYSLFNLNSTLLTIQGTLEMNNRGAFVISSPPPIYDTAAILRYNSGGEYIRNIEWSTNTGAGYPHHVEITNNTSFYLGGNGGTSTARTLGGNLTIASGSLFELSDKQTSPTYMTASLTVKGNINNAGTLNLSTAIGGNLVIEGNFTNSGTFSTSARTVTFNGSGTQILQADASTTFYNLTINKTAGIAQLAGTQTGINITNILKIDGTNMADLDLNNKNIDLGTAGILQENRASDVIVVDNTTALTDYNQGGAIIVSNRSITTSITEIAGLGIALNSSIATINNLTIYRYHYRGGSLSYNSGIKKVYRLSADAFAGNPVTLRIYYASQEVPAGMTVDKVYRWSGSVAPLAWNKYEINELIDNVGKSIQVDGIVNFSHWTLGQSNLALPISLLAFAGKKIHDTQAKLDWKTTLETNNKGFYIEKSTDGQQFHSIGFISGAGNSQILQSYNFIDDAFLVSAYYRLRQVDFDGNFTYSPLVWIENGIFKLYPNPITDKIILQIPTEATTKVHILLYDAVGRQVCNLPTTVQASSQVLTKQLVGLPAGVYILRVRAKATQWTEKIIKQ